MFQEFVVSEAHRGWRLDHFLQRMIPRMSRSSVQEAIEQRVTLSSGARPKPSRHVTPGDVVRVAFREREDEEPLPRPRVLLDAAQFMVVDKPAGLSTTPHAARPEEDVATLMGLAPAHRLDRGTTGCLLLVKTALAARHFEQAFREHRVRKEYLAVVAGIPADARWSIDAPLAVDPSSRVPGRMHVTPDGAPASTECELLGASRVGRQALIRARPRSGRRHQVRVHLAESGHPIVGDLLYGGDERDFIRFQLGHRVVRPAGVAPGRHLLHASVIAFEDLDGHAIRVEAPWPDDFPNDLMPAT
jgi:RluA family pseudouridine synthase